MLAYDSKPSRVISDRWWAAVILAQTFIIEYFHLLDSGPDHVKLILTAQAAGALMVCPINNKTFFFLFRLFSAPLAIAWIPCVHTYPL
jgi:hypothetical protein